MAYVKTAWVDDNAPAVNAANLNKIEQGVYDAHELKLDKPSAAGTDGQILRLVGGAPAWSAETGKVIASYVNPTASDTSTGITTTGTGDVLVSVPSTTYRNVDHYFDFAFYIEDNAGGAELTFYLMEGASQIATFPYRTPGTNPGSPCFARVPFKPTAGAHSYDLKVRDRTGGRTYTYRNSFFRWSYTISEAA